MLRLNEILDRVSQYHPDPDLDLIKKGYVFSAKVHQGQVRKSGEPYLIHPLEVAGILTELKLDEASIVAGLLHDTIEDTLATPEELKDLFGSDIAQLVDGVTKLSQVSAAANLSSEDKQAENFRKMLIAMSKDIRVILVKLADRTHNMRTLGHMKPEKQSRIAQETLEFYAPLANRLGISWIKQELEDLSFKYLHPAIYDEIQAQIEKKRRVSEKYIDDVIAILRNTMTENGLEAKVSGRVKHAYSVYRKMRRNGIDFEQVHDVIAFRLIVKNVSECYEALGLVHSLWKPVPGRFKDYIAIPKPNRYQSLHTTAIGPFGDRVEVQIRTEEMHAIAEEGIAAHWAYKEKKGLGKDAASFAWLRQLMEWQQDLKDPKEFIETVKVDMFADEVYIFTPKGDVKALPRGSTPVDFAYAIHSDIGAKCVGAKANGRIVPLRHKLKNGDTVEVLTASNAHPSKDWLTFVKTSRAQARIRAYIKGQQREKSLALGRDLLDQATRRHELSLSRLTKSGELKRIAEGFGYRQEEELLVAVGYGKVAPSQVLAKLVPPEQLAEKLAEAKPAETATNRFSQIFKKVSSLGKGGVVINGIDDVMVRFGRCCNPVPGDEIVGFITRGRGVTVHARHCAKALTTDLERRVEVSWRVKPDFKRPVMIRVITSDRPGLLADISQTFSKRGVNIAQANCRATGDDRAINTFEVIVTDLKQLTEVMQTIGRISGVFAVDRM